jgi:hypothetical protein
MTEQGAISPLYKCAMCGGYVNVDINPSTTCSECKMVFCDAWNHSCFSDYHKLRGECKGKHMTILNPQWKVNIKSSS